MPTGGHARQLKAATAVIAAVALCALPAVAVSKASHHSGHHFPSCNRISRTKLAKLAQTGPLTLRKKIGPLCEFTGHIAKHYEPAFDLEITPYTKGLWNTAKSAAMHAAAKNGSNFGKYSKKEFFVSGDYTDKGLSPCTHRDGSPGKGESKFVPACSPEPEAVHEEAVAYGTDKRKGLKLIVSAAVTGQLGDVHLSHMLELAKEVVSGKLH
jgi:hypothetical protein